MDLIYSARTDNRPAGWGEGQKENYNGNIKLRMKM